mgnify:CR=1 FL=1
MLDLLGVLFGYFGMPLLLALACIDIPSTKESNNEISSD